MEICRAPLYLAAIIIAVAAPPASAGLGDFTYDTRFVPAQINSADGQMMLTMGGQGPTSLNAAAPGGVAAHAGGICLIGTSTAPSETIAGPYTLELFLTDADSGQSSTFALTPPVGLNSQVMIPAGGDEVAVTTTDLPPTETQEVGSTLYTVSAVASDFFVPPGPPDKGRPGLTGGFVLHVSAAAVPEPGMICVFAMAMNLLVHRRRA